MAANTKELLFTKGFNSVYNRIENCRFVTAPFDQYINTGYWYAEKREGLNSYQDLSQDIKTFLNFEDSSNNNRLALTTSKVIKYTSSSSTDVISSVPTDSIVSEIGGLVSGGIEDNGTATSGGADTITDTTKSWTVNEFAGYYVWIVSGKGAGDVQIIESNTSDTITVGGWTGGVTPDSTSIYRIYPELALSSFLLSSSSGGYVKAYDGDTGLIDTGLPEFNKAVEYDSRVWYISTQNPSIVYYSEIGQALIIEGFITTGFSPIIDLKVFGDYLIVSRKDKILAIKKDVDSSGVVVYSLATLVEELGQISEGAIGNFNNGCYFISNDKNLYSLSVVSTDNTNIKGEIKNQGETIRGYLDNLSGSERFKFLIFKNDLHIVAANGSSSYEFIYDLDLEGWLVNTFDYSIIDGYSFGGFIYYGVGSNVCNLSGRQDLGKEYEQIISFIFGLDVQFNMHRIALMKFTLGAIRDTSITLTLKPYTVFGQIKVVTSTLNLASVMNTVLGVEEGGLGSTILGRSLLGSSGLSEEDFARVGVIEKKVNDSSWGFLHEVILSDKAETDANGFSLGGISVAYDIENIVKHIPEMVS